MTRMGDEKGMVLLLVLVVVALLSAIVVELGFSTLVDLRLTETFRDGTRAWYLAKGGVEAGRMILAADTNDFDHPSEPWGLGVPGYPVGEDGSVSIRFDDLSGRINVNNLWNRVGRSTDSTWVRRVYDLFEELGFPEPENLVAALIDWLDDDEVVTTEIDLMGDRGKLSALGAESSFYQSLESPYPAANAPLLTIEELGLVRGFTSDIVATGEGYLTVHGGRLNVNTASIEVLLAWDEAMTLQEAEAIFAAREAEPFESLDQVRELIGVDAFSGLNRNNDVSLKSEFFRIESRGDIGDRGVRRVTAVVDESGRKTYYLKVH